MEKEIQGDPEMVRIAVEVTNIVLQGLNEQIQILQTQINEQRATIDRLVKLTKLRVVK